MDKRRANSAKQFALYMRIDEEASASADAFIHAPAEFIGGVDETADIVDEVSNPYAVAEMSQPDGDGNDGNFNFWLLKHNFTTPETWILESDVFRHWFIDFYSRRMQVTCDVQIYSRPLSLARQEE
jgi:hypothetical protein